MIPQLNENEVGQDKLLFCSQSWVEAYENKMIDMGITYRKRICDGEVCFIIPRKCRPHTWKLVKE